MSFMARFRRLFWICANRPPYYDIINGSGLLYVISQCDSGVNLKKLVWPGRGWTFFILLWQGFIPAVPRARFFTPGNSFQYGIFLWWIMKIKRTLLIILSRVIRGAGMGLGTSGIALAGWFFFSQWMNINFSGVYFQLWNSWWGIWYIDLHMHIFMMNGIIIIKN